MQLPHMAKFDDPFSQESIDDKKKSSERTSSRGKLTKSGPNIGTFVKESLAIVLLPPGINGQDIGISSIEL